jgi:hypothetical protein
LIATEGLTATQGLIATQGDVFCTTVFDVTER